MLDINGLYYTLTSEKVYFLKDWSKCPSCPWHALKYILIKCTEEQKRKKGFDINDNEWKDPFFELRGRRTLPFFFPSFQE